MRAVGYFVGLDEMRDVGCWKCAMDREQSLFMRALSASNGKNGGAVEGGVGRIPSISC